MKQLTLLVILLSGFNFVQAVQPFYKFGEYNKSVQVMTAEVTEVLLNCDFELIGMFNPCNSDSLCVIVFTCDELTSMATGVNDKGAFGSTIKVGIIGHGNVTSLVMLNPCYFVHAYFNGDANKEEVHFMTSKIDSMVLSALSVFSKSPFAYGYNLSEEELNDFRYLPTMAKYNDVIELHEYDEHLEALGTIKYNLLHGIGGGELVYELYFEDKEIAVFGVAFNEFNGIDKELIGLVGEESLPSLPLEILVQGNVAYILNPKYRIPLYNADIGWQKLMKVVWLSSNIKDAMGEISAL